MSRQTKAELEAENMRLRQENECLRLVVHDMLVRGCPEPVVELEPDEHDPQESLRLEGRLFRPLGAQGGIAVVTAQTVQDSGTRSVTQFQVKPLDDLKPHVSAYRTAWGRGMGRLIAGLVNKRSEALNAERVRRGLAPIGEA